MLAADLYRRRGLHEMRGFELMPGPQLRSNKLKTRNQEIVDAARLQESGRSTAAPMFKTLVLCRGSRSAERQDSRVPRLSHFPRARALGCPSLGLLVSD
jgi:hypothetical protein